MSEATPNPVLEARNLSKTFITQRSVLGRPKRAVRAVRDVSLGVARGECLGVVGESGSGKSTVARLLLRLVEPDEGSVITDGVDLLTLNPRRLRSWRRHVQMVFQDPFTSMDPRMRIGETVAEPLTIHEPRLSKAEQATRVASLLRDVGIDPAVAKSYPSAFSGGQLQRIAIARALACDPTVLVCDEAVAALDMSIRGQILNLLRRLQRDRGIAIIFISHDLSLVRAIADRVVVMYRGSVVEEGAASTVLHSPSHPYTARLLDAVPVADPTRQRARRMMESTTIDPGPAAGNPGESASGCAYAPRCDRRLSECDERSPDLTPTPSGTQAACFLVGRPNSTGWTGATRPSSTPADPPAHHVNGLSAGGLR